MPSSSGLSREPSTRSAKRPIARALLRLCAGVGLALGASTAKVQATSARTTLIMERQGDASFGDVRLRDGELLSGAHVHYTTLGTLHRGDGGRPDNVVLLLHWTGASGRALLTPEYRDSLFAPGAPFDATRYFIVLPDALGHGNSSKPSDGQRAKSPKYEYGDIVDFQHKLVTETLGISHLKAIVGMSMGCMNAWTWAEDYPDAMDGIMPVACFPAAVSGRNLLWRRMVKGGITGDPSWANGNCNRQPASLLSGLEILRLMIDGVPHLQGASASGEQADAFIAEVAKQAATLDANDLLYSLASSGDFDATPRLSSIRAKVYALNFADDEFYRDSLQTAERQIGDVLNGRLVVLPPGDGSAGHLNMTHPALWAGQARQFVAWLHDR